MPNGIAHSTTSILAGIASVSILPKFIPVDQSICVAAGCLLGIVLTNDLDIDGYTESDGVVRRSIGYWPMQYWRASWKPYREAFKHRSFWSHFPIVSTLGRLLYLICPLWVVLAKDQPSSSRLTVMMMALISQALAIPFWFVINWIAMNCPEYGLMVVYGLAISDFLHWLMDMLL